MAGNINAALDSMAQLLARFPRSISGEDLYKAALLSKSVGRTQDATKLLTRYLDGVSWRSVSSVSFLGTLYFEQGLYREAEGAFRMSIRLGAANPPIHTMSMLVATALRRKSLANAHAVYAALLGHTATSVIASFEGG
eukprot:CAMPEP_0179464086 /NCGR_PEP_ID=MMETSP0799-20121207/45986_1 /TAXON_ID=46947 /ORGANISM="Geminigera cryophila, Strain CCMP2564" /LENGTH=137 /DNA_ID=CAMNT_0021267685 /DNA_START=92 /DNA_END=501 /DNA_ORIENTATION=-